MNTYVAVCPHSGGLQAKEVEVKAYNIEDALDLVWCEIFGSRYIARLYQHIDGQYVQVWQEGQNVPNS